MQLSIIIVSYNTKELTLQTLSSLTADLTTNKKITNISEIIVVDNNSKDGSVGAIKTFAQKSSISIDVIQNNDNSGFAAANNQGIERSKGKLIFLLNSDTIVLTGTIATLINAFELTKTDETTADLSSYGNRVDKLGIVAATLRNQDGSPQPQGGSFPSLWTLFFHMSMLDDLPLLGKLVPSTQETGKRSKLQHGNNFLIKDWVGGTAMMIKKELLNEIGPLDQNIFMYGEDIELCMRAKQHHWDIIEHLGAPITHIGNASGSSERAITGELSSYLYIWSKHKPAWQFGFAKLLLQMGCRLRSLLFGTMLGNHKKAALYQRALQEIARV